MSLYSRIILPILSLADPETVHDRTLSVLEHVQRVPAGVALLRLFAGSAPPRPVQAFGLTFPNPIGVAGGFDKDARVVAGLSHLGFGHVEVGTLTPRPQPGNPRPRVFRLPGDGALINRMGFPNQGAEAARHRLQRLRRMKTPVIVGVSLGKQRETPLDSAHRDYAAVLQVVYPYADFLTINVSSPNTPELRELQTRDYLGALLQTLRLRNEALSRRHAIPPRPLLLKISPDLTWPELDEILTIAASSSIDGFVATNTTTRPDVVSRSRRRGGGVSGSPLASRSNEIIRYIHERLGSRFPVIGVGGVRTADDFKAKLEAGASLVQIYTGLVYEGPRLVTRLLRSTADL